MKRDLTATGATFVCPSCWQMLADARARACPECAAAPPVGGWPAMPCSFRGRYVLTEQIGRDAGSALFHAGSSDAGGPRVLLEVARASGEGAASALARKLFRREATLAGLLGEASSAFFNLSSIEVTDPAYIAFEHVPWPALADVLAAEGPHPPVAAARAGAAILRGVAALEPHGLVHRALVPSRIFGLRNDDGGYEVKIAGFGVWPDGDRAATPVPSRDVLPYASPEQLRGEPLTAGSDVHMVASLVWELVTGQVPYPLAEDASPPEAVELRLRRLARVPTRPDAMPPELHELLVRALHPDPRKRWAEAALGGSAAAGMAAALDRFADEFPRRQEHERAAALRELGATTRALGALDARLGPLRALLDRQAEVEAMVQRLAQDPGGPVAVRAGVRAAEDALAELEAEVARLLSSPAAKATPVPSAPPARSAPPAPGELPAPDAPAAPRPPPPAPRPPPALSAPHAPSDLPAPSAPPAPSVPPPAPSVPPPASSMPPPRAAISIPPEAPEPSSIPPSLPPPSDRAAPTPVPSVPPDSMPAGRSIPPDDAEALDIPGVGGSRWPYAVGVLLVVALLIAATRLLTGAKESPSPAASASALASAPPVAPFGALAGASAAPTASAAPPTSVSAAPTASAARVAPSASAPRARPRPARARPADDEPAAPAAPAPEPAGDPY